MQQEPQNNQSLAIHLSALSSYIIPFGSLLLPIILWQSFKKDGDFVDHHGKESVNFNLSFFLYNTVLIIFIIVSVVATISSSVNIEYIEETEQLAKILFSTGGTLIAILAIILLSIVKIIFIIIASVKAGQGENYRYPLSIRFIK